MLLEIEVNTTTSDFFNNSTKSFLSTQNVPVITTFEFFKKNSSRSSILTSLLLSASKTFSSNKNSGPSWKELRESKKKTQQRKNEREFKNLKT